MPGGCFRHRSFALRDSAEICHFRNRFHSSLFTRDEARRVDDNIAKLPDMLRQS